MKFDKDIICEMVLDLWSNDIERSEKHKPKVIIDDVYIENDYYYDVLVVEHIAYPNGYDDEDPRYDSWSVNWNEVKEDYKQKIRNKKLNKLC